MLRRIGLIVILSITLLLWLTSGCGRLTKQYDIVIVSGRIVDGTGNPWFCANVGIKGDRIAQIGTIPSEQGRTVIDGQGLYVVPGFVDVHTHCDKKIDSLPAVPNYLLQGVTTIVGGNCGASRYPLRELFAKVEKNGIAINFATFVGHNTIRHEVMGSDDRAPTDEELDQMKELVEQEMRAGAVGLSTGLAYVPGRYSTTEEIIELTKMIAPYNGLYATHLRDQGEHIKEAIEEAIRIGQEAGVPVEVSHIKLSSETVWGKYHLITDPIEEARKQGLQICMDQYPYTATSSGFSSSFPGWAVAGGHEKLVERLENRENYEKIKRVIIERRLTSRRGIDRLKAIYITRNKNHPEYEGKNLAQILKLLGREQTISNGADLIIEMHKEDRPAGVFFQMAEEDVATLMQESYNMIASDGEIQTLGEGVPHPRNYGTFPRVLARYVRDQGVLTLPDAIRKMTSLPAQAMGFYDRGLLKQGMYADVVMFDLDEVEDTATFQNPHQYPTGIRCVIVNGKIAAKDGEIVATSGGMVLYGAGKQ